jgi:serine/threonine protein kinase
MAEVYLGTHLTLDRPVAVKVLHSHIESEPDLLTRFQREAKVIASLRHPNIVQIFDFDTYEGHPYIVMEYVNGLSFAAYLRNLHEKNLILPPKQIGRLLKSIAAGLDYAHSQGVIHRDIKPANILLHGNEGNSIDENSITQHIEPIITDFGLVRIAHSGTQTATGIVSGTPKYMSPEQARGEQVDHRTDIYSLGVVLYELIAGRLPFEADSTLAVIYQLINEPPPPIENASAELQDVINRALAKAPNERYQSAGGLAAAYHDAIGMHTEAKTIITHLSRKPGADSVSKKRKPARGPIWIGAGIFACACIGVLLTSALGVTRFLRPRITTIEKSLPSTEPIATAYYTSEPVGSPAMPLGILRFQNGASQMDQVTISAALDLPPENKQYEVWLIDDNHELSRSIGVLTENNSGQYSLSYIDPQSGNLLGEFNRMEITLEPKPDDSPNSSRNVVYSSSIPTGSLNHIRHLMFGTNETPGEIPVAVGLVNNVTLIQSSADAMLQAYEAGDKKTVKSSAEAIVNLIVGKEDLQYYNDWDENGMVNDPGDGFGLLVNGSQAGYLDDMIHHASYAAQASGAPSGVQMHAGHVEICIQNLEGWAPELRDLALHIARAANDENMQADVKRASVLADQMLNGIDINGNESIDPIAGEGGAKTAFEHAEYMSDMPILPGENQTP